VTFAAVLVRLVDGDPGGDGGGSPDGQLRGIAHPFGFGTVVLGGGHVTVLDLAGPVILFTVDLGLAFDLEVLLAVVQLDGRGIAQVADPVFAADAALAITDGIRRAVGESGAGRREYHGQQDGCG
jgi:hypothetical protein